MILTHNYWIKLVYLHDARIASDDLQQPIVSDPRALEEAQRPHLSFGSGRHPQEGLVCELKAERGLDGDAAPEEAVAFDGDPEGSADSLKGEEIGEREVAKDQEEGPVWAHLAEGGRRRRLRWVLHWFRIDKEFDLLFFFFFPSVFF